MTILRKHRWAWLLYRTLEYKLVQPLWKIFYKTGLKMSLLYDLVISPWEIYFRDVFLFKLFFKSQYSKKYRLHLSRHKAHRNNIVHKILLASCHIAIWSLNQAYILTVLSPTKLGWFIWQVLTNDIQRKGMCITCVLKHVIASARFSMFFFLSWQLETFERFLALPASFLVWDIEQSSHPTQMDI